MNVRLVMAAAWAVGALNVGTALAEESVSVLGINPAAVCSTAAATSAQNGTASSAGLSACDEAIKGASLTRGELAATYLNRGVLHLATANYQAAIADDDAALRIQANLSEGFANRGAALAAERHFGEAVGDFTQALNLAPKHPEQVYYNRGLAKEDQGDVKGAYLDYLKASQLNPGWDRPKTELARFTVQKAAQG